MKRSITALALLVVLSGCTFWEVDQCLDRGGRWDREKERCQFE